MHQKEEHKLHLLSVPKNYGEMSSTFIFPQAFFNRSGNSNKNPCKPLLLLVVQK